MTEPDSDGLPVNQDEVDEASVGDRRKFLRHVSSAAMCGGLVAGYGGFTVMAGNFLLQSVDNTDWLFVSTLDQLPLGKARKYTAPDGATVLIARQADLNVIESFIALSSVCPHLGCQVIWEAQNDRFFCPCHNGVFDKEGVATEGPPATAKQSLKQFPLKIVDDMLFIQVPTKPLIASEEG